MSGGAPNVDAGRLRSQLTQSTLGTIGFRLSGALGGVLCARLLAPGGRGQYGVLVVLATAVGMIGTAGLQFWVAVQAAKPDGVPVQAVIARHTRFVMVGLVPVYAVGLVVAGTFDLATIWEVSAAALLALATVWSMLELAVPNGLLRMGAVAVITTVSGLTYLAWMTAGLVLELDSAAYVVLGAAVANLAMVPLARRHRRSLKEVAGTPVAPVHRAAVRFGLPACAGELLTLATFRLDLLLVAAFLSRTEVGLYAVALAMSELLWVLPDGVAQVLLPRVARRPDQSAGSLVLASCTAMLVAGAVMAFFAGPLITTVFGAPYADAAAALPALVVAAVAMGAWKVVGADVVARGNGRARAWSALLGLVTMVGADVVLVPRLGISGAALGSAIAYSAAAAHLGFSRRRAAGAGGLRRGDDVVLVASA